MFKAKPDTELLALRAGWMRWPDRHAWRLACLSLPLLLLMAPGHAEDLQVAGVPVLAETALAGQKLLLNGAGIRTFLGFRVYVASLYLPEPTRDVEQILDARTAKRLQVTLLRDTSTEQNLDALKDGLIDNNSPLELAAIQGEIDLFFMLIKKAREVPAGTRIQLDYLPGLGTRLSIGGRHLGVIPGEHFNRAILKIWLGGKPIQVGLKNALLGRANPSM